MSRGRRPTAMLEKALLAIVAVVGLSTAAHANTLKVGDRLAELDVAVDARGKAFKLKTLKGKWLVVTIGAAWCKPCAKELPAWDKLAAAKAGKVTFVAIDIDDEIDDGKRFHDKLKLKNMTRVYMPNEKSSVAGRYGADAMPTTFVIDPQGIVRLVHKTFNAGDEKKLSAELDKLVK